MNIVDTLTSAAASAAKGAPSGMTAGAIGAAVGGLGGLIVDIAPEIGKSLFGDTGEKIVGLVAQAVETVTGTNDADAAQKVLARDPEAVARLRSQLLTVVAQLQTEADRAAEARRASELAEATAAAAGRAGGRNQTTSLMQQHNRLAWAPAMLSGIILVVFGLLIHVVLTKNALTADNLPLANVLLGTVAAMATQVGNYWLGSSSGSAAKSDQMAALTVSAQTLVPGDLVHRLLQQTAPPAAVRTSN
jgi:hypothetical protein